MGKDVEVGMPDTFDLDMGLDNINVHMEPINLDMGLENVNVDMGLDNVKVDMGLDKINVCMSFAIKEFPSMRVHFPLDFALGIKILGMEILGFNICGKAMVLTEDNPRTMFYTPTRKSPDQSYKRESDTLKVKIQDE